MNLISIGLLLLLQLLVFFSCGIAAAAIFRLEQKSVTMTLVTGFLFFFVLFGAVALPATLLQLPLHTLSTIVAVIGALSLLAALITLIGSRFRILRTLPSSLADHGAAIFFFAAALLIQLYLAFTQVNAGADAAYYLGQVSTDVFTDSLHIFDPYTGIRTTQFQMRYLFSVFPDYNAVISSLFGIHPLKQAKLIMPEIIMLISFLTYYQIGKALFANKRRHADYFMAVICAFNLALNTIYTSQTFIMTRTYEGKAILGNLIIPMLITCFILLYQRIPDKQVLPLILITSFAAEVFTTSAMMIVPVGLTAGLLPLITVRRNKKMLYCYLLALMPHLVVLGCYLLVEKGLLHFYIR